MRVANIQVIKQIIAKNNPPHPPTTPLNNKYKSLHEKEIPKRDSLKLLV